MWAGCRKQHSLLLVLGPSCWAQSPTARRTGRVREKTHRCPRGETPATKPPCNLTGSLRRQPEQSALLAMHPGNSKEPGATKMWAEPGTALGTAHAAAYQPPTRDQPTGGRLTTSQPPLRGDQKAWIETSEESWKRSQAPIPLPRERRAGSWML